MAFDVNDITMYYVHYSLLYTQQHSINRLGVQTQQSTTSQVNNTSTLSVEPLSVLRFPEIKLQRTVHVYTSLPPELVLRIRLHFKVHSYT